MTFSRQRFMAHAVALFCVFLQPTAASTQVLRGPRLRAEIAGGTQLLQGGMRPEVVADLFDEVQYNWVQGRRTFTRVFSNASARLHGVVAANHMASDRLEAGTSTRGKMVDSCTKVASSIVQGSSGDQKRVEEYMGLVCSRCKVATMCTEFASALVQFMRGDQVFNRNELQLSKFCGTFYEGPVALEATQEDAKAKAAFDAEVKAEADRVAAIEKAKAEEQARRKVEEEVKAKAAAEAKAAEAKKAADARKAAEAEIAAQKAKEAAEFNRAVQAKKVAQANKTAEVKQVVESKKATSAKDATALKHTAHAKKHVAVQAKQNTTTEKKQVVAATRAAAANKTETAVTAAVKKAVEAPKIAQTKKKIEEKHAPQAIGASGLSSGAKQHNVTHVQATPLTPKAVAKTVNAVVTSGDTKEEAVKAPAKSLPKAPVNAPASHPTKMASVVPASPAKFVAMRPWGSDSAASANGASATHEEKEHAAIVAATSATAAATASAPKILNRAR